MDKNMEISNRGELVTYGTRDFGELVMDAGAKQSRFSTLRMFKTAQNGQGGPPPPPPPKDPVYLAARNRSLASLSPADSFPSSPLSANPYGRNASAVSLALPPSTPAPKKRGFFKFGKSKSPENSPLPPGDDESISMPWNFSHNMHVDEAFVGMPPSWSTSLQGAGFTEDEIAAIQQRRMPFDRPKPSLVKPVPRSTSLPKSQHTPASSLSASSVSGSSSRSSPAPPPSPKMAPNVYSQETQRPRQEPPVRQPVDPRTYSPSPTPSSQQGRQYSPTPSQQQQQQRQYSPTPSQPRQYSPAPQSREPSLNRSPSPPAIQNEPYDYSPSPSPSPPPSPEPEQRPTINAKNLTLDLALEDTADSWSDAVLSATPWSASAQSPRFTVTAPPTAAISPTVEVEEPDADMLAYDEYYGASPSPSPSPTNNSFGDTLNITSSRDNRDRDSGMSDATMLGVPASTAGIHQVSIVRRAVATTVPSRAPPPASPQSSNFGSSSSSESQDHQTPTTELADDDDEEGEDEDDTLDYYRTGKNYLEENGFNFGSGKKGKPAPVISAEELEEERRQREWEEMQRSEAERERRRRVPSPPRVAPPAMPPPAIPPPAIPPPVAPLVPAPKFKSQTQTPAPAPVPQLKQIDPRAQQLTSPTDTFGGPLDEPEEDEEDDYEYGYDFPDEDELESESAAADSPLALRTGPAGAGPSPRKSPNNHDVAHGKQVMVALKCIALVPGGSQKLLDIRKECTLLRGLMCEQVLGLDALYVDIEDDALWIRMELMERSLADVVGLADQGLRLQEPRIIARFASDMLLAIDYLQRHQIAHRDLRSDNLLLNSEGVLKLTDFSNAVLVTPDEPMSTEQVGVMYWQAPEVLSGAYDPLKIDVWSVGATVWELAEANPPFADTDQPEDRWPPLSNPSIYPPAFHEFLTSCSEPAASRPSAGELLKSPLLTKACGRPVIVQLLSRCMAIEQVLQGDMPDTPS
uniref:STE/STE20/PAKA protein kinase n=1 Tax=Mycena chlorophos TaxID=658473 RepID=A0ABQ0M497_MYCCL|nr:STE/STE20/PAKA protein kinase [Mycena chlorophos]